MADASVKAAVKAYTKTQTLNDADLELTAGALFNSRVLNTGQVCNAAERVYVERGIAEQLAERVTRLMAEARYGNPLTDADLHMGPIINKGGLDKIATLVEAACKQGAQVLTGGRFHYEPTVLMGCTDKMDVMTKEIFGPVLPIRVVDDLDEALALANDSEYGLTSSVFNVRTSSCRSAERSARSERAVAGLQKQIAAAPTAQPINLGRVSSKLGADFPDPTIKVQLRSRPNWFCIHRGFAQRRSRICFRTWTGGLT